MRTVVGERPPELEASIRRRQELGQDGVDEVWEGEHHVAPDAHSDHRIVAAELTSVPRPRAEAVGLVTSGPFDLGDPTGFRVPDGGHRPRPGSLYVPGAVAVLEVLSADDETRDDVFAAHGVQEVPARQRHRSARSSA